MTPPRGRAERLDDFDAPGTAYAAVVRSPARRGAVRAVISPHLPRDYRLITADDIPGSRRLKFGGEAVPILASGRVSYRGEPIGLIAGPDRRRVEEAVALTRVEVDEEEPPEGLWPFDSSRLIDALSFDDGRAEAAAALAASTVKLELALGAVDHYYPEPQGAAAYYDYDKLIVMSSTQWPFHVRESVAAALGVRDEEVVVRPSYLGPHLDGKLWYPSFVACHAALCAHALGRPVLLRLSRGEDLLYSPKRAPFEASYRLHLDAAGRALAVDARMAFDLGAYAPLAPALLKSALDAARGAYTGAALRCKVWAVRSANPPMGAYAGLAGASALFAAERAADAAARAAGTGAPKWRLDNMLADRPPRRSKAKARVARLVEAACADADYARKRAAYELLSKRRAEPGAPPGFGIGLAVGYQLNRPPRLSDDHGHPSVELTMGKDLTILIRSSVAPMDEGALELWRAQAALTLDAAPDDVTIAPMGTDTAPEGGPSTFSSGIGIATRLILDACEGIRERRFREALPITVKKSYRPRQKSDDGLEDASWAAAVVELSLDELEGSPRVRGVWMAASAGKLLSEAHARASLKRDATRAVSTCLRERVGFAGGTAASYGLLRLDELPPTSIRFIEDDGLRSPGGLGELAFCCIPAAFANALAQANGKPPSALPLGRRGWDSA